MLSYKLPLSMLNTTDEPKVLFDKLQLSQEPSTVARRIIAESSELIEEAIKNKQDPKFYRTNVEANDGLCKHLQ